MLNELLIFSYVNVNSAQILLPLSIEVLICLYICMINNIMAVERRVLIPASKKQNR